MSASQPVSLGSSERTSAAAHITYVCVLSHGGRRTFYGGSLEKSEGPHSTDSALGQLCWVSD